MSPSASFAPPAPRVDQRLSKRVAEMVPCSRREAEHYIAGGWVKVDGQVVEEPQFRVLHQRIEIDPHASLAPLTPVTLLLHKPPGYDDGEDAAAPIKSDARKKAARSARQLLTPGARASDDRSGILSLKRHFADLLAPVTLERGVAGLLVFTQDWRVARKLTEDAALIEHEIMVEIAGDVSPETLQQLNHGLRTEGHPLPHVKVSVSSKRDGKSKLRFAVKGTHPGLIAYLCDRLGLRILSIQRIRIGRVLLAGLPIGQWRYLLPHERF